MGHEVSLRAHLPTGVLHFVQAPPQRSLRSPFGGRSEPKGGFLRLRSKKCKEQPKVLLCPVGFFKEGAETLWSEGNPSGRFVPKGGATEGCCVPCFAGHPKGGEEQPKVAALSPLVRSDRR